MTIRNGNFYPTWPVNGKRVNLQWGNSRHNWAEFYPIGESSIQEVQDGASVIDALRALSGFDFGDLNQLKRFRVFYDKVTPRFVIQKNTGTDASPTWVDFAELDPSTNLVTFINGAVFNGPITGVTTYNGVDVTNLSSRLEPGGADALALGTPVDVGSANAEGGAASFARSDHVHRGVLSVHKQGSSNLYGDVTLSEGSNITLTQASSDIEVAWSKPSWVTNDKYVSRSTKVDQSITTGAGETAITWDSSDTGDGHLFPGADGSKDYYVEVQIPISKGGTAGDDRINIRTGSTGTTADTLRRLFFIRYGVNDRHVIRLFFKVSNPSSTDVIGVYYIAAGSTTTIHGGSSTAGQYGEIRIWEIPA